MTKLLAWKHRPRGISAADRDRLVSVHPAPDCIPASRFMVTVAVPDWGGQMVCRTVRMDEESRELLLALPEHLDWAPFAEKGVQVGIGWPDHGAWHESLARFTMAMVAGSKFLRLGLVGTPVHHERRRHLRVVMARPVKIDTNHSMVKGITVDVSEAAMRLILPLYSSPCDGESVTVLLRVPNRHTEEIESIAFDGHVLRSVELTGHQAGQKEIVVLYDTSTEAKADAVRGLVYELGLQEKLRKEEQRLLTED
jgi:hypothetical protein